MNDPDREGLESRVLLLAPTVKDGELTHAILARAGIACVGCSDQLQLCGQLAAGVGAVLIAEEAVDGGDGCLAEWLGRQPPWSDLPVLILARAGASSAAVAWAMEFVNVTVLERPARIAALVSAVRTALRARQRQYQLRDQLVQRERVSEQLDMAMAAAHAGSWQIDLTTGEFSASDRAIELHGLPPGTPLNHERALACVHPDDRASTEAALRLTLESGQPFRHEHRVPQPDGSVRWVSSHAECRGHGRHSCIVGHVQDITDRKQAEEALRASEHRLAERTALLNGVLEGTTDMVCAKDLNGRLLLANAAFAALVSATPEQVVGKTGEQLLAPDLAAATRQHDEAVIAGGSPIQLEEALQVAGEPRVFLTLKAPLRDGGGRVVGIVGISRDITERKRVEDVLRESEARLGGILRQSPAGIVQTDAAGYMTLVNLRWCEMLGSPEGELLGRSIIEITHPSFVAATATAFGRLAAGGPDFQIEKAYCRKDGSILRAQSNVAAIRSPSGEFLGLIAVVLDISERLRSEEVLHRLATELSEADHRKDVFLATLAHELRNPLAPIRNGVQVMKLLKNNGEAVEQVRAMMERQLSQLVRLVDDLLDVSRITQGKVELRKERVDLKAVIDSAVETNRPAIEQAGHALAVVVTDAPVFVDGDATRLAQVVSNLLNNAVKYTHRGGHVRLTVRREDGTAVVSVKDSGIGIPPAMLGRVFETFVQVDRTLEKTTGGLGIGLSLVKGLLQMHGGTIEAKSDGEGMGSEFVVRLPVMMTVVAGPDRPPGQSSEVVPSARHRILVVDDNVDAADSLGQLLKIWGHEVRIANDGEVGIEVAAQFRPNIVLMDIGMPKLNGYEAARRIRQHPWGQAMVLVALTGWGQEDDRKKSADAGFDHHLVKPVEMGVLMKLMSGAVAL